MWQDLTRTRPLTMYLRAINRGGRERGRQSDPLARSLPRSGLVASRPTLSPAPAAVNGRPGEGWVVSSGAGRCAGGLREVLVLGHELAGRERGALRIGDDGHPDPGRV